MVEIAARVGANAKPGANRPQDVRDVQAMLLRHARWLFPAPAPGPTGVTDEVTIAAIRAFQSNAMGLLEPDGAVDPGGLTLQFLNRSDIPGPFSRVFLPVCWFRQSAGLTLADFSGAATRLECEVAAIQAVAAVETKSSPWDSVGRPTILFERHYFRRLTVRSYDRSHPDLSGPQGGYGLSRLQHDRLRRAAMLDEAAALQSASWGVFQIMGENDAACGFASVAAFVGGMLAGEQQHLAAFVALIRANGPWLRALRAKDWTAFARGYNGPGFADNAYDTKMAAEYARVVQAASSGPVSGVAAPIPAARNR